MRKEFKPLTKREPEKNLTFRLKRNSGHNNQGRITVRHKGAGVKNMYRIIDFGQQKMDAPAKVIAIEYDPFRTAFLCLLEYDDKCRKYEICPEGTKVGDIFVCKDSADIKVGNRMRLKNIPAGSQIYNIELQPNTGGKMVRSAGSSAKVMDQEGRFTQLIFPSTEVRMVPNECFASIGQVSFAEHKFMNARKAGVSRHKGIRPRVRGTAMNPCDHPHGGGEGRTGIGLKHPKTPWGKNAFGVKTRKRKWSDQFIIQRRKIQRRKKK
jgi:large subunit ribosomal protein L2